MSETRFAAVEQAFTAYREQVGGCVIFHCLFDCASETRIVAVEQAVTAFSEQVS